MNHERRREINAHLMKLASQTGDELNADVVIADAKNPASPLHDVFDWDRDRAAHAHWVAVANRLINGYRVEVTVREITLRAPVMIRHPHRTTQYVRSDRAADDRAIAMAMLRREAERVQAAIGRMQAVAAVLGLEDRVEPLEQGVRAVLAAIA